MGINRNIVECKSALRFLSQYRDTVLIETLWNVNYDFPHHPTSTALVLIETLWNVNNMDIS